MDLKEVTKDEFFAELYADPRDIMPSAKGDRGEPKFSIWTVQRTGEIWGKTTDHEDRHKIGGPLYRYFRSA